MKSISVGIKAAFGTWYGILGSIAGAISLVNLAMAWAAIPMSDFLEIMVSTYRSIFHAIVDWLSILFRIDMPVWGKDLAVLYGVVAGAFVRIRNAYTMGRRYRNWREVIHKISLDVIFPLLWPAFLPLIFSRPRIEVDGQFAYDERAALLTQLVAIICAAGALVATNAFMVAPA